MIEDEVVYHPGVRDEHRGAAISRARRAVRARRHPSVPVAPGAAKDDAPVDAEKVATHARDRRAGLGFGPGVDRGVPSTAPSRRRPTGAPCCRPRCRRSGLRMTCRSASRAIRPPGRSRRTTTSSPRRGPQSGEGTRIGSRRDGARGASSPLCVVGGQGTRRRAPRERGDCRRDVVSGLPRRCRSARSDREHEHRRKVTLQAPQVFHISGVDHAAAPQCGRSHHDRIGER